MPIKVKFGISISKSYKQAITDQKYASKWIIAVKEEIKTLVVNSTQEELILLVGTNLISLKWVFDVKGSEGKIKRFKVRLVARGFTQKYGINYTKTFTPTIRLDTLRIFFTLVVKLNLKCQAFDIKNAFTESYIKEDIQFKPINRLNIKKGRALYVLRSLYRLKQARRDQNLLLRKELLIIGFI